MCLRFRDMYVSEPNMLLQASAKVPKIHYAFKDQIILYNCWL